MKTAARKLGSLSLVLVMLAVAAPAHALRCGTKIIARGDHASKMLRYCGEPELIRSWPAQRSFSSEFGRLLFAGFVEEVLIEEWIYNFGPRKLMRVIRVENGLVTSIRHLGYGYTVH